VNHTHSSLSTGHLGPLQKKLQFLFGVTNRVSVEIQFIFYGNSGIPQFSDNRFLDARPEKIGFVTFLVPGASGTPTGGSMEMLG
jgi:hypothetical protein